MSTHPKLPMLKAFNEFMRRKPKSLEAAYARAFEAGWQASRAALVVQWPDQHTYTVPDVAGAAILDCRTACIKALKARP